MKHTGQLWDDPYDTIGYPSRQTAVALIETIGAAKWRDEVGDRGLALAERCHVIYGFEELSPDALARFVKTTPLRPTQSHMSQISQGDNEEAAPMADHHHYGFNSKSN